MLRQSLFLAISFAVSTAFDEPVVADYVKETCGHEFACDNEVATCWSHSKCVYPSGEALSGCCIPDTMDPNEIKSGLPTAEAAAAAKKTSEWEHLRGVVADYVIDNCGPAFACDNTDYGCADHSKCVNPSGEMLSGCCIPKEMDPEQIETGLSIGSTKKVSEWDHLRGVVADYVIDNCGPAFACDNTDYGCADHSKCVNPSGEMLSGCCIPKEMDPEQIETGLSIGSTKKVSEWEHLRGVVADYVIDNCGPAFACDNTDYGCADHSQCVNPSGEMLSGCCIPKGMYPNEIESGLALHGNAVEKKISEWEHLRGVVADYVIDNCGPAFACDNTDYGCADHSKCVNPSGEMLSGCCIPNTMDPEQMEQGLPIETLKKTSEWEHLRGVVADYVIDNCGPAFACDNSGYGCADDSKCVNPSGEMLSGCCIPKTMDANEIERGLPEEKSETEEDAHANLRGVVADYVIENCGIAFACDSIYGCADHSQCVNPSGEEMSGCCIPKYMDSNEMEKGLPLADAEKTTKAETEVNGPSNPSSMRGLIADYVADHCGPAFACDGTYGCGESSECINPSGEQLSGCCVPIGMTREDLEGAPSPADSIELGTLNGIDLKSIIAPYVLEHCGPAFACDDVGAWCDNESTCINPSSGPLAGCCVPKGMTREDLEGPQVDIFEAEKGEFGTLNGIDLKSLIDPYVLENCGPAFACDDIGAHCADHSSCINPSSGPLAGCCVPKGMTREELETGVLNLKTVGKIEVAESSDSICSASAGQCIPRVFMANETTHRKEEL